ncbi:MAG: hypothetical protein CVV64_17800 [Candidatus Wallbacteria bacterium HGW-Wallbacteria-1]|jgi:nitroreductase|uniref:FMN-binding domain-containing protein n=1 Tax=Candidatus Wallbacteria bacterium HGW-Wallbacteria-1 TaxID=2013854 RepID=A0A2N1PK30_9BACT|nr:MAG: hypothetical protein CVV64_17800 [Candidatus Wallbacteria bacterium HGW-Wallbacteria-1]
MNRALFIVEIIFIILILHVRLADPVPLLRWAGLLETPAIKLGTIPKDIEISAALAKFFPAATITTNGKDIPDVSNTLTGPARENGLTTWKVFSPDGKLLGSMVSSSPGCDGIIGYGGPVPILMALNNDRKILGVHPFGHSESESFVNLIRDRGIFNAFNNKTPAQAANLKVDSVSGATMTSSTVIKSAQFISEKLAPKTTAASATSSSNTPDSTMSIGKLAKTVASIGIWAVMLFGILSYFKPSYFARKRTLLLISSVVIIGFLQGSLLSSQVLSGWIQRGIPLSGAAFLVSAFALTILLFLRRNQSFYCFFICPFGAFQELMTKTGFRNKGVQKFIDRIAPWTRPIMFYAAVTTLVIGLGWDLTGFEPFSAFLPASAPVSAIVIAVLFLILASFTNRPWCRGFCPVGEFFDCIGAGLGTSGKTKSKNSNERNGKNEMTGHQITNILLAAALLVLLVKPHLPVTLTSAGVTTNGADTLSVIHSRKSVRKYTDKAVEEEKMDKLVRAGMAAPTAADKRPWDFVVVTDRTTLDKLADVLEYGKMLKQAKAAIVVCGNLNKALPGDAAPFWVQDCSAATENILLAAESLGLGAVWIGAYPLQDRVSGLAAILGCPEKIIPLNVISIGYPDGDPKPKNKYDATVIHRDKW